MEHPLVKLAEEISWDAVESEFEKLFSTHGRPSIPVRKIGGLLLLKEMLAQF
jgi:IS5 family transposase